MSMSNYSANSLHFRRTRYARIFSPDDLDYPASNLADQIILNATDKRTKYFHTSSGRVTDPWVQIDLAKRANVRFIVLNRPRNPKFRKVFPNREYDYILGIIL